MVARCSRSLYLRSKMPHCVAFECNTQAKNKKKIPGFAFINFRMMRKDDKLGSMPLEEHPCPKIRVCFQSISRSIALKSGIKVDGIK